MKYLRIVYSSPASIFIGETIGDLTSGRTNHNDVRENHRAENGNRLISQVESCLNNVLIADWLDNARNSIKVPPLVRK